MDCNETRQNLEIERTTGGGKSLQHVLGTVHVDGSPASIANDDSMVDESARDLRDAALKT